MIHLDARKIGHTRLCIDKEKRPVAQDRLNRPKEEDRPEQQGTIKQRLRALARGAFHHTRFRLFRAERHGWKQVGAKVNRQHLYDRQRQGYLEQAGDEKGHQLRHIAGKDIRHELAQVVVHAATLFNGGDDTAEVVRRQHHVGRLLCHIGAGHAHRNANVRLAQRWRVVDAIADHRDNIAARLECRHQPELVFRRHSRAHHVFSQDSLQVAIAERIDVRARQDMRHRRGIQHPDTTRHRFSRQAIIASDHHQADAGAPEGVDRLGDICARRIHHPSQPKEGQPLLHPVGRISAGALWQRPARQRQHAQRASGVVVVCRHHFGALGVGQGLLDAVDLDFRA